MIICHSRKFIFFSNPKTGSESIRALLEPFNEELIQPYKMRTARHPFYPHMSPAEAAVKFAHRDIDISQYFRFTCVRNPYARMVSLYEMIRSVDRIARFRSSSRLTNVPFHRWLRHTRPNGRGGGGFPHQKWRRYGAWSIKNWTMDVRGVPLVERVLRLEDLSDDLPEVLRQVSIKPKGDLRHLNRRVGNKHAEYYSASTAALLASRYAWDIENFNYCLDN